MTYFGGKNHLVQAIINRIPRHVRYVEPFAGSAAIARNLSHASESILLELHPPQAEQLRLELPAHRVIPGDGLAFLTKHLPAWGPETFCFVDPPYPISDRRDPRARYACELTDTQHQTLVQALLPARSRIMVCGMPWGLYATAFASWKRVDFPVTLRSGKPGIESVWMNYADAFPLHDYRYWGENKQQRQDFRRKVSRTLAKLEQLDRHERAAVLRAIVGSFDLA